MISFFEARERIVAAAAPLSGERVALLHSFGRVLAEDVFASTPLPSFDYSAMDGYAVRSADVNGSPRWLLPVEGECRAGDTARALSPKRALRIFTGAPLPVGADAVVLQEDVLREGDNVHSEVAVSPFQNVRRTGDDVQAGTVVLNTGTRIGAFHVGVLAALDRDAVQVSRRPRVAIISTGNELRPPGTPARAGSIPDSNGPAILALARTGGADAHVSNALPDELDAAVSAFSALLPSCDVLVTVGGVSVGDYDVVRHALAKAGVELLFWKIAIKPGKPLVFGRAGSTLVMGLPGNPVSAQLTFALLGLPLLRALQGDAVPVPRATKVRLEEPLQQKPGRLGIYRGRLRDGDRVTLARNQSSGSTVSLAQADVLVFAPADVETCPAGSELDAVRIAEL